MDLLRRSLAPVVSEAWAEIDAEARRVLELNLGGRKVVDFDGPHGWQHAAVNLGGLSPLQKPPVAEVQANLRTVQPLIELRRPFRLPIAMLDSAARGAGMLALDPVVEAAEAIARAEDRAIFHGYAAGGVRGIIEASPHKRLKFPSSRSKYTATVLEAREALREAGVNGPYILMLGTEAHKRISLATENGYPVRKHMEQHIIDGRLVRAPSIDGGVLLSTRGGDFVLTVGQDLSIGYAGHDRESVELYLTESFTFRVLDGAAAVALED